MEPSDPLGRMLEARELSLEALHDYAACVARVEKALTSVDGVSRAAVNLATEEAA